MDEIVVSGFSNNVESDAPAYSHTKMSLFPPSLRKSSEENSFDDNDFSNATLNFIREILMGKDFEDQTSICHDPLALQATENSFYEVLVQDYPLFSDRFVQPDGSGEAAKSGKSDKNFGSTVTTVIKNHRTENYDSAEKERSSKFLAASIEEQFDQLELFDKSLCFLEQRSLGTKKNFGQIQHRENHVVDLNTALIRCAEAVANNNFRKATEELKKIRRYSSPFGDATQRLSHYFVNALEARMAGTGSKLFTAVTDNKATAADHLRDYKLTMEVCPFNSVPIMVTSIMIAELSQQDRTLHIVDFGILYGFQWPSLIQRLSNMPGGPPKLRITGIDFPQPGFRPAQMIEETGRNLAKYCERFNVPFEYTAIAKKWETIQLEDLEIDKDEVTIVHCFKRFKSVRDEMPGGKSARDEILKLIAKIDPDMFIHCVLSGSNSSPFFVTRFREVLFHYTAIFDIFEAIVPREDGERLAFEKEIMGKDVMNSIACEGVERVEILEKYKQWEARSVRAGLKLLPMKQGIVERARAKVKSQYHKDYLVDEDGGWLLQGWKGRMIGALSCWKRA